MNSIEMPNQEVTPEEESQFNTINFHDINGAAHEVVHPILVGKFADIPREDEEIEVSLASKSQTMTFGEYLQRIGVKYDWFFKARKTEPDISLQELLKNLHQQSVDNRTTASIKQHQKYTHEYAGYDNLQQETTKDHSLFFTKLINDLGIEGLEARAARHRQDYLDGIDEVLEFDPTSMHSQGEDEGEKVIIGIQRSFSDKKREITKDPIRFFPEDPEVGAIFRVFIQEDIADYVDQKTDTSFMQKLLEIRAQKAREAEQSPDEYAKSHRNEGLPTVEQVLPKGQGQQIRRVLKILEQIKGQTIEYLSSDDFSRQSPFMQAEIKRKIEFLDIDSFIADVESLKMAA